MNQTNKWLGKLDNPVKLFIFPQAAAAALHKEFLKMTGYESSNKYLKVCKKIKIKWEVQKAVLGWKSLLKTRIKIITEVKLYSIQGFHKLGRNKRYKKYLHSGLTRNQLLNQFYLSK